jgi:hypothetical protein
MPSLDDCRPSTPPTPSSWNLGLVRVDRFPFQVREVLRLKYLCGQSGHRIAVAVGISRYTVAEYLRRAAVVGVTWPVPPDLDDTALERKLFTPPGAVVTEALRPQPDWVRIHAEMRRAGVTLLLL